MIARWWHRLWCREKWHVRAHGWRHERWYLVFKWKKSHWGYWCSRHIMIHGFQSKRGRNECRDVRCPCMDYGDGRPKFHPERPISDLMRSVRIITSA
jgi:hypothetical protein